MFCTFFREENMLLDINLSAICTILYYLYLSHIWIMNLPDCYLN